MGDKVKVIRVVFFMMILSCIFLSHITGVKILFAYENNAACINLNGHWEGMLNLVNYTQEPVSATITQEDCTIRIITTSTLLYGKYFVGNIDETYISVQDVDTGEIWTTHSEVATEYNLQLQDFVNGYSDLDELTLQKKIILCDFDNDGNLELSDIIIGLQIVSGIVNLPGTFVMSDISNDQRVGIEEVIYLLNQCSSQ